MCRVNKDGVRRFYPVKPLEAFVFETSLIGHVLLADRDEDKDKEKEAGLSLFEARLFNQFSRHTNEYLGETRELGRFLYISPAGRPDAGTQDILSEDIGLNADGSGERWDMVQFKDIGIEAAKEAGIANPNPDEVAWSALYEAAKQTPLYISSAEAETLMKLAFYALGPEGTKLDEEAIAYVAKHAQASLKDHLNDSTEEFDNKCIKDPKSK